jgi:predicted dehydrogenase
MSKRKIRWGMIGLGKIAHRFAQDIRKVPNAELYAVSSREYKKARAFALQYDAITTYDNFQSLVEDPQVDAVYIATPHAYHREHTLLCLNHKKAVLCEKPFAINGDEVAEMIETARSGNVLLMEAMWTYFLPHYQKVLNVLNEGVIGNIVSIKADFGFKPVYDPESRVFKKELGGGSLLDIGIYPIFFALTVLGMPEHIEADATFFENGVDSSCKMIFSYNNNVKARLECTFLEKTQNEGIITGDKGILHIHPKFHAPTSFSIVKDGKTETYDFEVSTEGFSYEIEHFSSLLQDGKTESTIMTFNTSEQLITLMDEVRKRIGLVY